MAPRPSLRKPQTLQDLQEGVAPQPSDWKPGRPVSMVEVEERIMRADDELTRLTESHMELADMSARAEATWKAHRDRVIIAIVANGEKGAADTREAKAKQVVDVKSGQKGEELYETYLIAEAATASSARAMRALESRLSAFQTLASNLRNLT